MSPDADDDGDADGEDVCSRGEGVRDCDEPGCGDGVPLSVNAGNVVVVFLEIQPLPLVSVRCYCSFLCIYPLKTGGTARSWKITRKILQHITICIADIAFIVWNFSAFMSRDIPTTPKGFHCLVRQWNDSFRCGRTGYSLVCGIVSPLVEW